MNRTRALIYGCLLVLLSSLCVLSSTAADGLPDTDLLAFPEDGCFDVKENGQCTWIYTDETEYLQEWKGDTENGQGILTLPNGARYAGVWKDGKPHGHGTYILSDGSKYVGEWKNGLPNGRGHWALSSGREYSGEIKEGRANGLGFYTFTDGSKYLGEFVNGQFHGQGTLTIFEGTAFPEGHNNCRPHGQRAAISHNERNFVGKWKNNRPWEITAYDKDGKLVAAYREGVLMEEFAVSVGCSK